MFPPQVGIAACVFPLTQVGIVEYVFPLSRVGIVEYVFRLSQPSVFAHVYDPLTPPHTQVMIVTYVVIIKNKIFTQGAAETCQAYNSFFSSISYIIGGVK